MCLCPHLIDNSSGCLQIIRNALTFRGTGYAPQCADVVRSDVNPPVPVNYVRIKAQRPVAAGIGIPPAHPPIPPASI